MALSMDFIASSGVSFKDTYTIIYQIGGTKESLKIQVFWYVDKQARMDKLKPIEVKNYSFAPNVEIGSENFIKQGYEYLKTLEEFQFALDILNDNE